MALYDICDLDGRIYLSGEIVPNRLKEINLSDLNRGQFHLFIIDGEEIKRDIIHL